MRFEVEGKHPDPKEEKVFNIKVDNDGNVVVYVNNKVLLWLSNSKG